jgi:2-dehydro-3-deoxyphosphogluconate aldolase/(4S)-4-hydroxy-2-oxoglutarate aldolase
VNAIVHAHPTCCTALAIRGMEIPAVHYMIAISGGNSIRCAPYRTYGTQELSDAALAALERVTAIEGLLACAGTVLTPEQAAAAAAAGAAFAVAPGTNEDVVAACRDLGLPFFPGVATPSEIERARQLGLHTLKVFPAEQVGGPAFLRAVSATYPDVRFLPTGGIGPANLRAYLDVPSVLAVGGSWLVKTELLRTGRFDEVERLTRETVELLG